LEKWKENDNSEDLNVGGTIILKIFRCPTPLCLYNPVTIFLQSRSCDGVNKNWNSIILKWVLKKYVAIVWTGFIWLRIVSSGGLL
jgi:hypothetical protein